MVINLPKPFDNAEVYKEMRLMTLNCQTKDAFTKTQGSSWKYDIIGLGLKINIPPLILRHLSVHKTHRTRQSSGQQLRRCHLLRRYKAF